MPYVESSANGDRNIFRSRQICWFLELDFISNICLHFRNGNTHLLHRISVTNGYAAVVLGVKVVGDAEGSTDLVLTAISLTDRAGLVKLAVELLRKLIEEIESLVRELLGERKNRALNGSKGGMKVKYGTNVALGDLLLVICVNKECKSNSVRAERGLYNVGNVVLVCLLVEEGEILAGVVTVLGKVVVGSVGNTPELAPTEGEEELEVGGCLGIEAKLLGIVVTKSEVLILKTDGKKPLMAEVSPILEPLEVCSGLAEELKLHLLKLTHTEDKVTGSDLVTEGLTDLCDTERHLLSGGSLYVYEVGENTLSGLGTEIYGVLCVLGYALEGLEHKVELTDVGEVVLAAGGAKDVMLFNEFLHFCVSEGIDGLGKLKRVLCTPILDKLISTESFVALAAVHKGIREACKVTGSYPSLGNIGTLRENYVHSSFLLQSSFSSKMMSVFLVTGAFWSVIYLISSLRFQSILKEISPEYTLEELMLTLKLITLATWCEELTHWKRS